MVSAMNGQKTRVRRRYYACPTALTNPPTTPPPLPPMPPPAPKQGAAKAGLFADLLPGMIAVATGLALIAIGAFPQALAVI
jgi:hypothetical protein